MCTPQRKGAVPNRDKPDIGIDVHVHGGLNSNMAFTKTDREINSLKIGTNRRRKTRKKRGISRNV